MAADVATGLPHATDPTEIFISLALQVGADKPSLRVVSEQGVDALEVGQAEAGPDAQEVAASLRTSIGMLLRRMRQERAEGDLTLPESSALARLDRGGPVTAAELARQEQISPQSMGATLAALQARGLIERWADPEDGRRFVLYVTEAGTEVLHHRRSQRTQMLAVALTEHFSPDELALLQQAAPLLERLAEHA
jgi:DNA-binding MarR family transcriptional regulator